MIKKVLMASAIIAVSSVFSPVNAQLLSTNNISGNETTKLADNKQDWSLYTDSESKMVYVDFEKINVNLNGLVVKDAEGKVIFKDDALWQLPVNSIYEVDFSKYPKGEYTVELKSFTTTIRRQVKI